MLKKIKSNKRKGTTGKVDPLPQFLAQEKLSFQRHIAELVTEPDILPCLIINIDQTPLSYVNTGKHMFSFKATKKRPHKKRGCFRCQLHWRLFADPANLFRENQQRNPSFSVTFTENHWSNTEKSVEYFEDIIFPYLEDIKRDKDYPSEQHSLIIVDTFQGQDNDAFRELCGANSCDVVIGPENLTNWTYQ